jgi:hypothetical protein
MANSSPLERGGAAGLVANIEPVLHRANPPHRRDTSDQPMHLVSQDEAAQEDSPIVDLGGQRMRMRDHPTDFRSHTRLKYLVGRPLGARAKVCPQFCASALDAVLEIPHAAPQPDARLPRY